MRARFAKLDDTTNVVMISAPAPDLMGLIGAEETKKRKKAANRKLLRQLVDEFFVEYNITDKDTRKAMMSDVESYKGIGMPQQKTSATVSAVWEKGPEAKVTDEKMRLIAKARLLMPNNGLNEEILQPDDFTGVDSRICETNVGRRRGRLHTRASTTCGAESFCRWPTS